MFSNSIKLDTLYDPNYRYTGNPKNSIYNAA